MPTSAAGFWSYVQQDDQSDSGRVLSLADRLQAEYRLHTAESLELFVDRDSLEWGAQWEHRIDAAIAGTTFFIPVITPSYFKSAACRKELLKFAREADRLGLQQLLLPVYWVTVAELESNPGESSDEAIRLIARYQWEDFREVRLEDETSSVARKAVNVLATELAKRTLNVNATVDDLPEVNLGQVRADAKTGSGVLEEDDDAPGFLDGLATSEDTMPKLTKIMEEIGKEIESIGDAVEAAGERMDKASSRTSSVKAQLVVTEQLAKTLADPTVRIETLGSEYAAILTDLDPGVHAMLDGIEVLERDDPNRAEFLDTMSSLADSANEAVQGLVELVAGTNEAARFSRSLKAPLRRMQRGLQFVVDGRTTIQEWGRRAEALSEDDREVESG